MMEMVGIVLFEDIVLHLVVVHQNILFLAAFEDISVVLPAGVLVLPQLDMENVHQCCHTPLILLCCFVIGYVLIQESQYCGPLGLWNSSIYIVQKSSPGVLVFQLYVETNEK